MEKFLPYEDVLGTLLQEKATELFRLLSNVDADSLGLPEFCLHYYKTSHSKRLFFSIETSAHLLYRSIKMSGKTSSDVVLMDYGAGVGTVYLLAKLIGCKKVIYNDHLEDWRLSAKLIAEKIGVQIDHYIVGDIGECLDQLDALNLRCDVITSRNVIEHIYKLSLFYRSVRERQPQALIISSTTANKNNPASVIKHILWHRKWEKVYSGKRMAMIEREAVGMPLWKIKALARATRGLAGEDLRKAIDVYRKTGKMPDPKIHGTNTCDPYSGVWAEHLLSQKTFRSLINEKYFAVSFAPGFWDTHYKENYMNNIGRTMNGIIGRGGSKAMRAAPFIYVIAEPK